MELQEFVEPNIGVFTFNGCISELTDLNIINSYTRNILEYTRQNINCLCCCVSDNIAHITIRYLCRPRSVEPEYYSYVSFIICHNCYLNMEYRPIVADQYMSIGRDAWDAIDNLLCWDAIH